MLIRTGRRPPSYPSSALATATLRSFVLPNGSQLASTLNHAKNEGMTTTPKSTTSAIVLRVACRRSWRKSRETLFTTASRGPGALRSEEHTSELQSRENLVCRLLLEKKKHA